MLYAGPFYRFTCQFCKDTRELREIKPPVNWCSVEIHHITAPSSNLTICDDCWEVASKALLSHKGLQGPKEGLGGRVPQTLSSGSDLPAHGPST